MGLLVLLDFSPFLEELIDALLASPLAARLAADGVQLQPDWAGGRPVFAAGATEADFSVVAIPWSVAVHSADEEDVLAVWRRARHRDVCRSTVFERVTRTMVRARVTLDGRLRDDCKLISRTFLELRSSAHSVPPPTSASAPAHT